MARALEIFLDYACPWCYFSMGNIEKLQQQADVAIERVTFALHPDIPEAGRPLKDLFAGLGVDVSQMLIHLKRMACFLKLPFTDYTMRYNSRKAQELTKWAADHGRADTFNKNVFHAYFAEGLNIATMKVLGDIARRSGLDPDEAEHVLADGLYRSAVDRDWHRSKELRITTGPTFIFNGRRLVGVQSCTALNKLVNGNGS